MRCVLDWGHQSGMPDVITPVRRSISASRFILELNSAHAVVDAEQFNVEPGGRIFRSPCADVD